MILNGNYITFDSKKFLYLSFDVFLFPIRFIKQYISISNLGQNLNPTNKSQLQSHSHHRSNPLIHPFLSVIFGSAFLLIFMTVMVVFIYGFINKQCNQWHGKRSSRHRKKRPKSKNVIRDESTILGVETDIV
jgi:ATP/ADP translocase